MIRFLRRLFARPSRLPTIFVGVADAYPQVPALRDEIARLARNRYEATEIRLTAAAFEQLCEELGVIHTTHVCGLPIRIVGSAQA